MGSSGTACLILEITLASFPFLSAFKKQSQVMLRGMLTMTFKIFHISYRCTTK